MPNTVDSRQRLTAARTLVVKLGTQLLTEKVTGQPDAPFLGRLARQVASLRARGVQVTVVSSGAVGAGVAELGLGKRPTDLAKLQATAAVGQRRLMDAWAHAFEPFGLKVAQLLLTREDIDDRTRFLNVRNTINAVQEYGAVPIINENDTISTDELVEISFGDNDILAGLVANALRADVLVLLSVVDGLLDDAGQPVRLIESLAHAATLVRADKSPLGKGGMNSKLEAARMVTQSGEVLVVADGRMENVLPRIVAGEAVGTLFTTGAKAKRSSRSRWIGSARPAGTITVDDGAVRALLANKSLLPIGITKIVGEFDRGDVVDVRSADGTLVARGLSNYTSDDVARIRGKKTAEVRSLLAEAAYDEVVHRDNLVLC